MNRWILLLLIALVARSARAQMSPVVLEQTRQPASRLVVLPDGNVMADFGRAAFGQIEITARALSAGDTLRLHLGECVRDGRVDRAPGGSRRYRMVVVPLREGTHTYRPDIPKDGRNTSGTAIRRIEKAASGTGSVNHTDLR